MVIPNRLKAAFECFPIAIVARVSRQSPAVSREFVAGCW
jgi:hypothetical protein